MADEQRSIEQGPFVRELAALLNRRGIDNRLGIPDYILAEHLEGTINALARLRHAEDTHSSPNRAVGMPWLTR